MIQVHFGYSNCDTVRLAPRRHSLATDCLLSPRVENNDAVLPINSTADNGGDGS